MMPPPKQSRMSTQELDEKPLWLFGEEGSMGTFTEATGTTPGEVMTCLAGPADLLLKSATEMEVEASLPMQQEQQQKSLASIIEKLQRENALREQQNELNGGCEYDGDVGDGKEG